MMFSHNKIFTICTVISLHLSLWSSGGQCTEQIGDNGNGTQTIRATIIAAKDTTITDAQTQKMMETLLAQAQKVDKEQAEAKKIRDYLGCKEGEKRSLWYLPVDFVTTLVQPFVQDAPKVVDAVRAQGVKIQKEGLPSYVGHVVKEAAQTVWDHPLETMMVGGLTALKFVDVGGLTPLVQSNVMASAQLQIGAPLAVVGIAKTPDLIAALKEEEGKLREEGVPIYVLNRAKRIGQVAYNIARNDTFQKAVLIGAGIGAASYVASSFTLPGASAQWVPSLETEYRVTSTSIGSLVSPGLGTCPLTGGGEITFTDASGDIIVCGLGQTSVTRSCSTMSTSASTVDAGPCVACSTLGPCIDAWGDSTGTKILARCYWPNNGTFINSPTQYNTASTVAAGATICSANPDGTLELSWTATSSGSYQDTTVKIDALTCAPLYSPPAVVNENLSTEQAATCFVPFDTTPPTALAVYGSSSGSTTSVLDRVVYTNGTAITAPQTIASLTSTDSLASGPCDRFTNGDAIVGMSTNGGANPTFLTVSPTTGSAIGSTYQLPIPAVSLGGVAGLQNGNAMVVVSYNGTAYGGMFNPSGVSQCTPFQIPVTAVSGQGAGPVISLGGTASNPIALSVYVEGGSNTFYARSVSFTQSTSGPTTSPPVTTKATVTTAPPPTTTAAITGAPTGSPTTTSPAPTSSGSPAPTTTSPAPTSSGTPAPSTTALTHSPTSSPSSAGSMLTSTPALLLANAALTLAYWLL